MKLYKYVYAELWVWTV